MLNRSLRLSLCNRRIPQLAPAPTVLRHVRSHLTKLDRLRAVQAGYAAPKADRAEDGGNSSVLAQDEAADVDAEEFVGDKSSVNKASSGEAGDEGGKLEWYNDSHLLSARIKKLLDRPGGEQEAKELVERHTGASNAVVYGTLMTGLGRRGLYKDVLAYSRKMQKKGLRPTPHAQTAILNSLAQAAFAPGSDATARTNRLAEAREAWENIERPSTIHLNTTLKACLPCVSEGGWDFAWELYRESVPENGHRPSSGVPIVDVYTVTYMLRICAALGGEEGVQHAMKLWDDVMRLDKRGRKLAAKAAQKASSGGADKDITGQERKPTPIFKVDEHLLGALLMCFIRAPGKADVAKCLPIIQEWTGLPIALEHANNGEASPAANTTVEHARQSKTAISTVLLSHLMHVASRLRQPDLALAWFEILVNKRRVVADGDVCNTLVGLLISTGAPEKAWELMTRSVDADVAAEQQVRICAYALSKSDEPDRVQWLKRGLQAIKTAEQRLFNDKLDDVRSAVNVAEIYIALDRPDDAWRILESESASIIETTRHKVERLIIGAGPNVARGAQHVAAVTAKARANGKPLTKVQYCKQVTAFLARNPKQEADLAGRLRALHLMQTLATTRSKQTDEGPSGSGGAQIKLSLTLRRIKEVLGLWDMMAVKLGIPIDSAPGGTATSEDTHGSRFAPSSRANDTIPSHQSRTPTEHASRALKPEQDDSEGFTIVRKADAPAGERWATPTRDSRREAPTARFNGDDRRPAPRGGRGRVAGDGLGSERDSWRKPAPAMKR
ncbi:hypothetical protein HDU87_008342 [Geranomyces variabilis]|uniref:Pentatricopeptide repeat protein n=1 Tax=Geranomyces variabilis TaxID=109894 RepID=A0AAD5XM62_9FUNG|nr:hypothetical protein HDU87_008342 [Geranomyces variabilis]